jgi:hypothetical protein
MSDKTLFNQDLTLNSLTLNNSTASNASGYVASSSTFTGNSVSTSSVSANNFYFTGANVVGNPRLTGANDDIYAITQTGGSLILQTPTASCPLTISATNYLNVPNINTTSVILGSGSNTVGLLCPTPNNLTVLNGTINATTLNATNISAQNYNNVYYGNSTNNNWTVNPAQNSFTLSNIGFASTSATSAIGNINTIGAGLQGCFLCSINVIPTGNTSSLVFNIYNATNVTMTVYEVSFILYNPNAFGGLV